MYWKSISSKTRQDVKQSCHRLLLCQSSTSLIAVLISTGAPAASFFLIANCYIVTGVKSKNLSFVIFWIWNGLAVQTCEAQWFWQWQERDSFIALLLTCAPLYVAWALLLSFKIFLFFCSTWRSLLRTPLLPRNSRLAWIRAGNDQITRIRTRIIRPVQLHFGCCLNFWITE